MAEFIQVLEHATSRLHFYMESTLKLFARLITKPQSKHYRVKLFQRKLKKVEDGLPGYSAPKAFHQ
jgi:hypothetical protein